MKHAVTLLAGAVFAACSSNDDGARRDEPSVDAGTTPPPLDAALFDCTAAGRARPAAPPSLDCVRDPTCKGRFVGGHRGAGGDLGRIAPEDTLAAYRAAYAIGVELVETDPRETADGVLVNVHDDTVDRTTEGTGEVAKMTLAEVQSLRLKTGELAGDFSCERIPTLEEVLAQSRGHAIVLVDANKSDLVEQMVEAIRRTDTLDWAIFDTSSVDKIDRALAVEPKLMIQVRAETESEIDALIAKYGQAHAPIFVEISQRAFPTGVTAVHAAGLRVFTNAFGTDIGVRLGSTDRSGYLAFFDQGADAIQSDLPDEVARALGRAVPSK